MAEPRIDPQPALDAVNHLVTNRPKSIMVVFLLVTALFAAGLPLIELDPGEEGFTEGTPEQEALDAVEEEFDPPFADDEEATQLIQRGENVLSQEGLLRMLRLQQQVESDPELRVVETSSPAGGIARTLDPTARSREAQIRAVEGATDTEVRRAVRTFVDENPGATRSLSDDFNRADPSASATIGVVQHEIPADSSGTIDEIQDRIIVISDSVGGDIIVFGTAIFENELEQALVDSLSLMVPAVVVLILGFLAFAYRDPFDLVLGLAALSMAVIWTFGFLGHAGIPFNQMMTAVPPLLLAAGIDFGIHAVNRYREERVEGRGIHEGMTIANNQLLVAFFIVTGTTSIGFGANMTSDLTPIFDFGFVAALGIVFTFLIFGIFMPAAKVWLDTLREETAIPSFGSQPLGSEESLLGEILPIGARIARRGPAVMLALLLVSTVAAGYVGTDVGTEFDDEDFLPYDDPPVYISIVPEPLGPGTYDVKGIVDFLGDNFDTSQNDEVTVFIEGPLEEGHALESVHRAGREPPENIIAADDQAVSESIVDVIDSYAAEDEEFATLVERSDTDNNGVPDRNLELVYDQLFASEFGDEASSYMTEDRRSMRVVYSVDSDASQSAITADAREVAAKNRLDATATGEIIVFQTVTELLFQSAIVSLAVALLLTAVFLVIIYDVLEGRATLGLANLVPIVSAVAFLSATMVVLDIPFNAITATLLAVTIGIGVDYSVHVTHRFIDEYNKNRAAYPALLTTLRGAGGGITGSMITTAGGVGALVLSVTPMLGEFGILMAVSIVYSYLAALIVLPPSLLLWERYFGDRPRPAIQRRTTDTTATDD